MRKTTAVIFVLYSVAFACIVSGEDVVPVVVQRISYVVYHTMSFFAVAIWRVNRDRE